MFSSPRLGQWSCFSALRNSGALGFRGSGFGGLGVRVYRV